MALRQIFLAGFLLFWVAVLPTLAEVPAAGSQDAADIAYSLVQETTEKVMVVVDSAQDYVDDDPERYYDQVQSLLDPLLDYRGFARKVMGPYASSKRYRSLDEAGREQLRDQLDRFTDVMRTSLVRTYSKGLLAFGSSKIKVLRPEGLEPDATRATVRQEVEADRPLPYEVLYQMGQDREGQWQLRNVIIESVNLGEIYRDQFLASAREQDGDLNKVIDSWETVTVDVDAQ